MLDQVTHGPAWTRWDRSIEVAALRRRGEQVALTFQRRDVLCDLHGGASVPDAVAVRPWRVLPVVALSVFLALYGNAVSTLLALPPLLGGATGVIVGVVLTTIVVVWAWPTGMTWNDIGLGWAGAGRSAAIGLLAAAATVLPALLILRFPPLVGEPVTYDQALAVSSTDLALRVFVLMPLDTIIPEELAFRGLLLGSLLRRYSAAAAVVLAAIPFTVWHVVIVGRTILQTNLTQEPLFTGLGFAGALVAVFIGGIIFGWLRVATGHLAGSLAAHWGFNSGLILGLRVLQSA
jgi:membrane protease YdiL (CAAX protease family)